MSIKSNKVSCSCLVALLVILIGGCTSVPFQPPIGIPNKALVENVNSYPQKTSQCGPESLAVLLNHAGIERRPEELTPLLYLPQRDGTLQIELVAQARQKGLMVYPITPSLGVLLQEVAAGRPVLILQNLGFNWWPQWHYAVVTGYDLQLQTANLNSAGNPNYQIPLSLLDKTWQRAQRWGIVLVKPGDMPITAEPTVFLRAAADLEESGQAKAAFDSFNTASQQWSQNKIAWFGLANSAYTLEDYPKAKQSFEQVIKLDPRDPGAWNNLAYTLLKQGCTTSAHTALNCAAKLAPNNIAIIDSVREFSQYKQIGTDVCSVASNCPKVSNAIGSTQDNFEVNIAGKL